MNPKSMSASSKSHGDVLLHRVMTLRNNKLLFDCTLKADGQEVPVHKLVLAACSDYFQAMFCGNMRESKQNTVELQGITAETLKTLVDYAYTGDLHLTLENVEDVVSGAQYFQMADAVELCSKFLQENLTWETVQDVQNMAATYALDNLQKAVEEFMLKNFESISKDTIHVLKTKQLLDLLGSNSLIIKSEYTLFEKLMSFKSILSEDIFHEALSKVRFSLMTSEELSRVSDTEVMSSSRNQFLLEEAQQYEKDAIKQAVMQTPRTQVRSDKTSFIFTGNDFLFHTREDKPVERFNEFGYQEYFEINRTAVVDNFLYVCGIFFFDDPPVLSCSFYRFDPRFSEWEDLEQLKVPRTDFPLIPHNGQIYAIGGGCVIPVEEEYADIDDAEREDRKRRVECYTIGENRWRMTAPINYDNFSSAGVVYKNKIYVSGGEDFAMEDAGRSEVTCYDPASDSWQFKSPMIHGRYDHHMMTIKGKIYAFGGTNISCASSVEYFEPEINQWTLTTSELPGLVLSVVEDCTDVYICRLGEGADDNSQKIIFEKYDIETGHVTMFFQKDVTNITFDNFQCRCITFPR